MNERPRGNGLLFPILWSVVCLLVAATLLVLGGHRVFALIRGPADFDSMPIGQIEGAYVTLDVTTVLDEYAYSENSGGKVVSREFAVASPDGSHYLGVLVPEDDYDAISRPFESLANDAYPVAAVVTVTGTVYPMDGETKELFDNALRYYTVQEGMAVYAVLHVGDVGSLPAGMIWLMAVCAAVLIVVAVAMLALALTRVSR